MAIQTAALRGRAIVALALTVLGLLASATAAQAEYEITEFGVTSTTTQAGGHPDVTISFKVTSQIDPVDGKRPTEDLRATAIELPPGLIGNAADLPACSRTAFIRAQCPAEAQVGTMALHSSPAVAPPEGYGAGFQVFNIAPGPGEPGRLGLMVGGDPVPLDISVRSGGDYGLTTSSSNILTRPYPVIGIDLTLWGVPADPAHDMFRGSCGSAGDGLCPSSEPRRPFMVNPTECGTPEATIRLSSYQQPERWIEATTQMAPVTGCDLLDFDPSLSLTADTPVADRPSGLKVGIGMPHDTNPDGLSQPALRKAVVRLPEGVTVNPAVVDGRVACSNAQFAKGSAEASTCPSGSKIGTVELDVPSMPTPLPGDVYIGAPEPGNLYRLFLYLEGQGTTVKLEGELRPDAKTGQITAVFADNPQVPFRSIELRFPGGARSAVLMPRECGSSFAVASLTPYSDSVPTHVVSELEVSGCLSDGGGPFVPAFDAGSISGQAGGNTDFVTRFSAPDGHQLLSGLDMDLPAGVLGTLRGLPKCSSADADANRCSDASLLGDVKVSVGSNESPVTVSGKVFLTEPRHEGDVAGLAVAVPARVGPYDLGTPVVRADITADPDTARLSVTSDPFPQILEGVQLRIRQVLVDLDRPGFMRNPTNCSRKTVEADLMSVDGALASVSSPFSVRGCSPLSFRPRMGLRLRGKRQLKSGRHPGLVAQVRQGAGQAAIRKAVVRLPRSLALDPENAGALCGFEQGTKPDLENHCPEESIVGRATARSPLLNKPQTGDVYFVKNVRIDPETGNEIRTTPMLVAALRGEIAINLRGTSSSTKDGRLVSTFAQVPDAPVGRFRLALDGGDQGILVVTETARGEIDLCDAPQIAEIDMRGQNGRPRAQDVRIGAPCPKRKRR